MDSAVRTLNTQQKETAEKDGKMRPEMDRTLHVGTGA